MADGAYARVAALYEFVTASAQLASRAEQLPRLAATLAVQRDLSKQQRLERFAAGERTHGCGCLAFPGRL